MNKEIVTSDQAQEAVGPYSQARKIVEFFYTSSQIGLLPGRGELVSHEVGAQAEQALQNLGAVLEAAGTSLAHVVKTTVFLRYMKDYKEVNEVYARYFGATPPARSAVAVAGLPLGAKVEIEAVAVLPQDTAVSDPEPITVESDEPQGKQEKGWDPSAQFITTAVGAVETAVATGLRQISNFLAETRQELEKRGGEPPTKA